MIHATGEILLPEIHKPINSVSNREDQWKESITTLTYNFQKWCCHLDIN
jgi:hypothetical protein